MNQTAKRAAWKGGDEFIPSISCLKRRHPFPVPVSILTETTVVDKSGRKTGECEDEWEKKIRTSLPQKKVLHINQTYIPTVVYIGIVVDGVILLKAFVGYANV
jgi:hypothetical protein